MTEEQARAISQKLANCMDESIIDGFVKVLDALKEEPAQNVCICIGQALLMGYTSFKADCRAKFLEIALRHTSRMGQVRWCEEPAIQSIFCYRFYGFV